MRGKRIRDIFVTFFFVAGATSPDTTCDSVVMILSSLSHDTRVTLPMVIMAAIATAKILEFLFIFV